MNNNQLALLVKKSEIDKEEKVNSRRFKMAEHFLKNLGKGSDWLIKENLKLLYFYKDFDFVIKAVKELQEKNESEYLAKYIEEFFNGSLDVDDLLESQERVRKLRESRDRMLKETEETKTNENISLLINCQKNNVPNFVSNNVGNAYTKSKSC